MVAVILPLLCVTPLSMSMWYDIVYIHIVTHTNTQTYIIFIPKLLHIKMPTKEWYIGKS